MNDVSEMLQESKLCTAGCATFLYFQYVQTFVLVLRNYKNLALNVCLLRHIMHSLEFLLSQSQNKYKSSV